MQSGYIFTDFPLLSKYEGRKTLKCTSFILIDKTYGPMVFDTGSAYDTSTLLLSLKKYYDLDPEDIKWVFITHIHPDHIGANRFFKKAKIILSQKDFEFSKKTANAVFEEKDLLSFLHTNCPGYKKSFGEFEAENMKNCILEHWSEKNIGINLNPSFIEDKPDIPPFIKIIPTPGHTFYHYSFIIKNPEINIFIAGDSLSIRMILRDDNDEERFTEPHMDFNEYFKTLNEIKSFNGLIVPGHDRPFFTNTFKAIRKNIFRLNNINNYLVNN